MRRLAMVLGLTLVMAMPGSAAPAGFDATVATTERKLLVYGQATPSDRKVRMKLLHDAGDGFKLVARDKARVRGNGTYEGSVARPNEGVCKVIARYRGERLVEQLGCYRPTFGSGTANFVGADRPSIEVEIADTPDRRQYGLMYRKWLHPDKGMAFEFEGESSSGFWMKNTLIPLSIAFYDASGTIVDILDMEPCPDDGRDCPVYTPDSPYLGALEVNQGAFTEWGLEEGDRILVQP